MENISCTMCVCVFLCGEVHDHRVSFSEALRSGTVQIEKAEETSRLDIPASQACRISLQVVSAQMRSDHISRNQVQQGVLQPVQGGKR